MSSGRHDMVNLLLEPLLGAAGKILDRVIPDKAAAEKAKLELLAAAQSQEFQLALEQVKLNAIEAQNPSLLVSGWRPGVGWVCVVALAYNFILHPLLSWGLALAKSAVIPPTPFNGSLMELTLGMLGMAGLRSWEKYKGVAGK